MIEYKLRALRLTLTALIVYLITWYFYIPERPWSLITIWFVMFEYTNIGGVFIKGINRIAGTLISALYGLSVIYFFSNDVVINMIAIVPGVFIYAYYFMDTEKSYIALIGCVTLTIVLLNHNDIDAAIWRTYNVIMGTLASMFMMRFFFPHYATDDVMKMQIQFIENISIMMRDYLDESISIETLKQNELKNEHIILTKLVTFETRIKEAMVETQKSPLFIIHLQAAKVHIRYIFRLLSVFVSYTTTKELRSSPTIQSTFYDLLTSLSFIQKRLENPAQHFSLLADSNPSEQRSAHRLLDNIHKEVQLLDNEIKLLCASYI